MTSIDISSTVFSYFVGGLALISTLISLILYCRDYLPGAQIKLLDELLQETKTIYEKAEADGLLPSERIRPILKQKLDVLERASLELRELVYSTTSSIGEWIALLRMSRMIAQRSYEVKGLRSHLITTSKEQRRWRDSLDDVSREAVAPVQQVSSGEGALHSDPCSSGLALNSRPSVMESPATTHQHSQFLRPLSILESDDHSLSPTLAGGRGKGGSLGRSIRRLFSFMSLGPRLPAKEQPVMETPGPDVAVLPV